MQRIVLLLVTTLVLLGCDREPPRPQPKSATGVRKVTARVQVQADGLTIEQGAIRNRLALENILGSIKHLYIISAYSGQVIVYSTVKGKVVSSGKRLTPYTVASGQNVLAAIGDKRYCYGIPVHIDGRTHYTSEVLQDDGTYGHSIPYLYWWDVQGRYHQHYVSGGQIIHVSDQPIAVKSIILNLEITDANSN